LLAAGLILACGLGTGLGTHWAARADDPKPAQKNQPDKPPATVSDLFEPLQPNPADATALDLFQAIGQTSSAGTNAVTPKWEYDFVQASALSKSRFVKFLGDREASG